MKKKALPLYVVGVSLWIATFLFNLDMLMPVIGNFFIMWGVLISNKVFMENRRALAKRATRLTVIFMTPLVVALLFFDRVYLLSSLPALGLTAVGFWHVVLFASLIDIHTHRTNPINIAVREFRKKLGFGESEEKSSTLSE